MGTELPADPHVTEGFASPGIDPRYTSGFGHPLDFVQDRPRDHAEVPFSDPSGGAFSVTLPMLEEVPESTDAEVSISDLEASDVSGVEAPAPSGSVSVEEVAHIAADDAGAIGKVLRKIFSQAVKRGAKDIHFEPRRGEIQVGFRLLGSLRDIQALPLDWRSTLIAQIKGWADLDTENTKLPQDGHVQVAFKERNILLRISTTPTLHGEAAVMSIQDGSAELRGLEELGLSSPQLQQIEDALYPRNGLILTTGPRNCGKTTSLYSLLRQRIDGQRKVVTLETSIEQEIEGALQIPVQPRAGWTLASGMPAVLHQDPDVLMVSRVPDESSAKLLVRAAMTEAQVMTSLQASHAPEAVSQLVGMGVPAYEVADSLRVVVAQRLVRRICSHCRTEVPSDEGIALALGIDPHTSPFYAGSGCDTCQQTGFDGHIALFQVMPITPALRALIAHGAGAHELAACATSEGMTTLRSVGLDKAREGLTSFQEVLSATIQR